MSFFKSLFSKKDVSNSSVKQEMTITSFEDFWNWFLEHEQKFHKVVKSEKYINADFLDKVIFKLNQLREGIYCLTGMLDSQTVDLVFTSDGNVKNFHFVEELVETCPKIEGWNFRAHKPSLDIESFNMKMHGFTFNKKNINFYSNDSKDYPDEISITIIHDDYNEKNKSDIINGCYILLDNYLGELKLATMVDGVEFIEKSKASNELVPLNRLKDFIIWREKEFIEKYEGTRRNTENDNYTGMQGKLKNDMPLIAMINSDLLDWDGKASHPWLLVVEIQYDGKNNNGLPDESTYHLLNSIEESILSELKDFQGYLNVGRQTADNSRNIFFACKEFRKPCKVLDTIISQYSHIHINYNIYKDKYWQSLERFKG